MVGFNYKLVFHKGMKKDSVFNIVLLSFVLLCGCEFARSATPIQPVPFKNIRIGGELRERVCKNFNRLEEEKYRPDKVFLTEEQSGGWPGDTEGRTILGLVMDAQASGREPVYLKEILNRIPTYLNKEGYMGPIYEGKMNEQQLSGNGWMLRGLCEYYLWKKDTKILKIINSIATNLFIKGKGYYSNYPLDPALRDKKVGGVSGTIQSNLQNWMLSSDVGCIFIGMEGAIQAYQILRLPQLKEVIDEMLKIYLSADLVKLKAQAHATLTGLRGLIRYSDITGDTKYIEEVAKRWQIYKTYGMTENFANYNWLTRYSAFTEPCAIIDSYMVAVQMWQHTGNPMYRNDAEMIYYNAICHAQRSNGGFGCDDCPGNVSGKCLNVQVDEAHWCCTMRGGEGLGSAVRYTCFSKDNVVCLPFYHASEFTAPIRGGKSVTISEVTDYPFSNNVSLNIIKNTGGQLILKLAVPYWMNNPKLTLNGKLCPMKVSNDFVALKANFKKGDKIVLSFVQSIRYEGTLNKENTKPSQFKIFYGPMLLAAEGNEVVSVSKNDKLIPLGNLKFKKEGTQIVLSPVYHLMSSQVHQNAQPPYQRQIIFE